MRINSFATFSNFYSDGFLNEFDNVNRTQLLQEYPFSIMVEGDVWEHEMAVNWLSSKFPNESKHWFAMWYGKTDYDYGFTEYFFSNDLELKSFESAIPNFHLEGNENNKWKSDGFGKFKLVDKRNS